VFLLAHEWSHVVYYHVVVSCASSIIARKKNYCALKSMWPLEHSIDKLCTHLELLLLRGAWHDRSTWWGTSLRPLHLRHKWQGSVIVLVHMLTKEQGSG
jgi:hypothetical protein